MKYAIAYLMKYAIGLQYCPRKYGKKSPLNNLKKCLSQYSSDSLMKDSTSIFGNRFPTSCHAMYHLNITNP